MIGQLIDCPSCRKPVEVSLRPSTSAPQPSRPISPPRPIAQAAAAIQKRKTQGPAGGVDVDVERRSGWGAFWSILGVICLIIGIGGFILGLLTDEPGPAFIFLISGCVAGLQSFFFAFLTNVFTDIRWVLTLIYRKN